MTKYHLRYRNINQKTLDASREMLNGWSAASDTERWQRMDVWIGKASEIYRMSRPVLVMNRRASTGHYTPSRNEIHMAYPSIVTVIHEFRHAMQHANKAVGFTGQNNDVEPDARGWSLSVYYKIAPRLFRKLVREGKIFHITPDALLANPIPVTVNKA
jgi:hypothetical protein